MAARMSPERREAAAWMSGVGTEHSSGRVCWVLFGAVTELCCMDFPVIWYGGCCCMDVLDRQGGLLHAFRGET